MSEINEVRRKRHPRRRRGLALIATGALVLGGPLLAGAVSADTLATEGGGDSGDYVPQVGQELGSIEVTSGEITKLGSHEAAKLSLRGESGEVKDHLLLQQLEVTGNGEYSVLDPAPAQAAKNLNAMSPFLVDIVGQDGQELTDEEKEVDSGVPTYAKWEGEVKDGGVDQYRWLGLIDKNRIPFTMEPEYILNGQSYSDPTEIVGESGEIEVRYNWKVHGQRPTTLYFQDGDGNPVQNTGPVYLPLVGVFKVPLPSNFSQVRPITMDAAPDGFGGALLAGTLVMAPPLGPTELTVGFTADVEDFFMPTALVEWVLVNPPDNGSFSVIGSLLGSLGGALTGASTGLAGTGQSLNSLANITDAVGGAFDSLTDIQATLQDVQAASTAVIQGVNDVSGRLGGATETLLDLNAQLRELLVGEPGDLGPIGFLNQQFNNRMGPLKAATVAGLTELESSTCSGTTIGSDFDSAPTRTLVNILAAAAQNDLVRELLNQLGLGDVLPVLDELYERNPAYSTECAVSTMVNPNLDIGNNPDGAGTINIVIDAGVTGPVLDLLAGLALPPEPSQTKTVPGINIGPTDPIGLPTSVCDDLFPVPPIGNSVPNAACKAALGSVSVTLEIDVRGIEGHTYQDAAPIEYLAQAIKGQLIVILLGVTDTAIGVINTVQGLLTDVTSGVARLGTLTSGVGAAIGEISTTINSVIFQGLSGLVAGVGNALPALGSTLSSTATTLNYEFAVFNAYGFMGTLGGAQPYGPPWLPQDISEFEVDPNTGAVIRTPAPSAGQPLPDVAPAANLNPVPAEPPDPAESEGDPTTQAIDKAGYTAYQVDILGFGGERGFTWGLYFAAVAAILIGGIAGGLVMSRRG